MERLEEILRKVSTGEYEQTEAAKQIERLFFTDIGHSVLDADRRRRTGQGEVVYCAGKSTEQVLDIFEALIPQGENILGTRMSHEMYTQIEAKFPSGEYREASGLFMLKQREQPPAGKGTIAVVSAGTSDAFVAEEAAETAKFYGHTVLQFQDVGVAGIHRLLRSLEDIRSARVVIVVAGMEGALASVVGGLVDVPVIAVPTSVGYGANYQGLSALLAMLNSCSSGISVVNIDNGFGAGYLGAMINSL
ncbi:MAG: nickel pincer cofactor biosynthesis protein LarB [Spirochaetota bacterium]